SSLAGYLLWQLGIAVLHTDTFHDSEGRLCAEELLSCIQARLNRGLVAIIEGIFVLDTIEVLGLRADFLVYVEKEGWVGAHRLADKYEAYQAGRKPAEVANFVFRWSGPD